MTPDEMEARTLALRDLLRAWLAERVATASRDWLRAREEQVATGAPERVFFTSFSAMPRYTGKADLDLSAGERAAAEAARPGWEPARWSVDQAGRALLMLSLPHGDPEAYRRTLQKVFATADVGESVALYQSLPLLPHPDAFRDQAAEGVRSNMTSVFNAVALRNPYPAAYFDESAWNQMVLKAVFIGSPLYLIRGLEARANPMLARMLVDYAHERWAAGRAVTPELWRPVGPFAGDEVLPELERVLAMEDPAQHEAAALALAQAPAGRARELLAAHPELQARIAQGALTWEDWSRAHLAGPDNA